MKFDLLDWVIGCTPFAGKAFGFVKVHEIDTLSESFDVSGINEYSFPVSFLNSLPFVKFRISLTIPGNEKRFDWCIT